jgi:hypothetical protein
VNSGVLGSATGRGLILALQQVAAASAVRGSAVRGGGAAAASAYSFCATLDLAPFAERRGGTFLSRLDASTDRLRRALPSRGRSWGAARNVVNLFLREALYNRHVCAHFRLDRSEEWLELPLGPILARRLRSGFPKCGLPPWRNLDALTPAVNSNYQGVAAEIAETKGIARVHLEALLWPPTFPHAHG